MARAKRSGVLFLCVANSSRSQMAEGFARRMAPEGVEVFSAGSQPTRLNPMAVEVMREVGIDIAAQESKSVDTIAKDRIETVITLCAQEVCPAFPGDVERHHWPFEDPATLDGSQAEQMQAFRRVRDAIRKRLIAYFGSVDAPNI